MILTPDHRALGTKCHGFQHVLTRADAAVEPDFAFVPDSLDHAFQHADRRQSAVQLPPAVIADRRSHRPRHSTANLASSASRMPFRMNLPPQSFLISLTFSQSSLGSNCELVHSISERGSPTPSTWPTMLRKDAAPRAQHAKPPAHLGRHVDHVRHGQPRRRREPVLQVLVALPEDLQVERQHQRRDIGGLGAFNQALGELPVPHDVELEPERMGLVLATHPRSSRSTWSTA